MRYDKLSCFSIRVGRETNRVTLISCLPGADGKKTSMKQAPDSFKTALIRRQLKALASHLARERKAILKSWRLKTVAASEVTTSASLTRIQFNDHIPLLLDVLARRLRCWPRTESRASRQHAKEQEMEHGIQRWQQGYHLPELICEWGHLQVGLMETLDAFDKAHPEFDPEVMPIARNILLHLSNKSINTATAQYWRLYQAEAAGHVGDLEQALATLNELEQRRAASWREAAHDLRGSMSVVQGTSDELEDQDLPASMRQEFYGLMQTGMRSLHLILSDLMYLARLDAGQELRELEAYDAAEILKALCLSSRPLAQKRDLYLEMQGPDSLPVVGDRAKLVRIVQNLLLNSLKYTRQGGVTVLWSVSEDPNTSNWEFCIQDTGPGLAHASPLLQELQKATRSRDKLEDSAGSKSYQHQVPTLPSQSLERAPDEASGEGIGLSIVKRLCEVLEASLELESSVGNGSTFRITLPRDYA